MEWHAETGLVATMVEAPLELQRQLLPFEQIQTCSGVSEESSATTVDQDSEKSKMREKTTRYAAPCYSKLTDTDG